MKKAIAPLLADLAQVKAIEQVKLLLTDPEEHAWSRPWQVNRYKVDTFPGIQEIWDLVAQTVAPLLLECTHRQRLGYVLLLQYAPSHQAAPSLLRCLDDPDLTVQLMAINALAEANPPGLKEVLFPRLQSEHAAVRWNAAAALGQIGETLAYPHLVERLARDRDPRVRRWAALALAEVDPKRAVGPLMKLLRMPSLPHEILLGVKAGLNQVGPLAIQQLIDLIGDPDPVLRLRAIEALEPFALWEVDQCLRTALQFEDTPTQLAAAWVLASHKDLDGFQRLRAELVSPDSPHRLAAACYMTILGMVTGLREMAAAYFDSKRQALVRDGVARFPQSERDELAYFVEREQDPVRARAFCDMAGALGAAAAIPPLMQRIRDSDPLVAITAATSLIRLRGSELGTTLEVVLTRFDNPIERTQVARSLRQLWSPIPLAACEVLVNDGCAGVVIIGLELLARHPDPEAIDWIVTVLETEHLRRQGKIPPYDLEQNDPLFGRSSLIGQLVTTGESIRHLLPPPLHEGMRRLERDGWAVPSVAVAQVAMAALMAREASQYLSVIEQFLNDRHPLLRFRALEACVALGGSQALTTAADLETDPDPVVRFWWKQKKSEKLH
ncbi:MAG: HEAT repeat domain-containing protein [Bradymonadales bacterium]|nr:HEAT repeat domain-containing protein [Bradymonadales bacterium]